MKKRKIAVLIGLFACALLALGLAACGHQHTYGAGWTYDATHHWHEATCEHSEETEGKAEHTWDGGTVTTAATCTEGGVMTYTCTVCDATKQETIPATGHTFAEEWSTDATHHWHAATCEHTDEKKDYAEHTFEAHTVTITKELTYTYEQHTCSVCSRDYGSEGLVFTPLEGGYFYGVSGIGTCADKEIYIPTSYNGLPVWAICANAFQNNTTITGVTMVEVVMIDDYAFAGCTALAHAALGEKLQTIDSCAFSGCASLAGIHLPESLSSIGSEAFSGCTSLAGIHLPESLSSIGSEAFSGCTSLASIAIPGGVSNIYGDTFTDCTSLAQVTIGNGVKTIYNSAFHKCTALKEVIIPDSVTQIELEAFIDCTGVTRLVLGNGISDIQFSMKESFRNLQEIVIGSGVTAIRENVFFGLEVRLKRVYYHGTEADWNKISIESGNTAINSLHADTLRYYYSETQPTAAGNWWHFDIDGVTPVIW